MSDPTRLAAAVLAFTAAAACGQTAPPTAPSSAPVAAAGSAFEAYRPFADEPLIPWRQANDQVGRIGGWRAYAREAQGEEAAPAARPAADPASTPAARTATPAASAPARTPASGARKADPHAGHH